MVDAADVVRWTSGALQAAGVLDVAWGIRKARQQFVLDHVAWWVSAGRWLRRHVRLRRNRTHTVTGSRTASWNVEALGAAVVTYGGDETRMTMEQRLDLHSRDIRKAHQRVTELRNEVKQRVHGERERREELQRVLQEADAATREALQDYATGGLRLRTWSATAIVLGLLLAAVPGVSAELFSAVAAWVSQHETATRLAVAVALETILAATVLRSIRE